MHWVLQNNIFREKGMEELRDTLEKQDIPYSEHKVVPFVGELQPDINPEGPVMVIGSYSIRHVAKKKGWIPGVLEVPDYRECISRWGSHIMLNGDAQFWRFGNLGGSNWLLFKKYVSDPCFIRPVSDAKYFAGTVMSVKDIIDWRNKVVDLGESNGTSLDIYTLVLTATPKKIYNEYRFWIVDNAVITSSMYKRGTQVVYKDEKETDGAAMGLALLLSCPHMWQPARAYVLDIGLTDEGWKVVEINNINSAGLYAANVPKLVYALNGMEYE